MSEHELIEALANKEHVGWANWMNYLFSVCEKGSDGSMTIPAVWVERWQRQIDTPYIQLSEQDKQSDRNQVADTLPIIAEYIKTVATTE